MNRFFLLPVIALLFVSCSNGPEKISYGEDHCTNCEMAIMDKRYGAEIVTIKGKVYKFDSVECMAEFLKQDKISNENLKMLLVTPFNHPGQLVDAKTCRILHSKKLPSPMGKYLTAFKDESEAAPFKEEFGGDLYNWEDLVIEFNSMN
jgi:copper chaperone NosL